MHEKGQKTLNVSLPYRGSNGPLNLLIDSTGIKAPLGSILRMRLPGNGCPNAPRPS